MKHWMKTALSGLGLLLSANAAAGFSSTQWGVHITNFTGGLPYSPTDGWAELTYPIKIVSGPLGRTFYYSQYVYFNARDQAAYYNGIQPSGNGQAIALFSYFGDGARAVDTLHCASGADGGSGVTCNKATIPFKLGVTYYFKAKLVDHNAFENTWEGSVLDSSTNTTTKIGSWATPASAGYLSGSSIGFIEDYVGINSCADIPATSAYFGQGVGVSSDGQIGYSTIDPAYGVGVCKGKVPFQSVSDGNGGQSIVQENGVD